MNFFEAQEKARRNTWQLVVLFILAVVGLILVTTLFVSWFYFKFITHDNSLYAVEKYFHSPVFFGVSLIVLIIVAMGGLYQYSLLSKGGKNVAEMLGGRQLGPNSKSEAEKRLLNVVEEMSIASGILTPTIYLLEEKSINAFAAGMTIDDAVIGITKGAVEKLDRNELQGVIAHEFSHIFNGDMRLNMHLTATLHGIMLIGMIGEFIMRHLGKSRSSHSKRDEGNSLALLGFGLFAIGYIGVFFGSLIKAFVSRNREYLADATAVQYTRFPAGIAGALKKILYYHSTINSASASTYAHFYFSQGVSNFFATHPPLRDRIYRVDRKWDGKIPDYEKDKQRVTFGEKVDKKEQRRTFIEGAVSAAVLSVGSVEEDEVQEAHETITKLDEAFKEKLNDPLGAQAALLMLFYQEEYKEELFASLKRHNPYLLLEFANLLQKEIEVYKKEAVLIVSLALYTLKSLSVEQYRVLDSLIQIFVDIDEKVSMYEWSLQYIIRRNLQMYFGERKVPKKLKHSHIGAVKNELEVIFSMLMHDQYESDEAARRAFSEVMHTIGTVALEYHYSDTISHEMFENAMKEIELIKPGVAKRVFEGVLHSVKSDSLVTPSENLFVHAVALLLQVPLPREFSLTKRN